MNTEVNVSPSRSLANKQAKNVLKRAKHSFLAEQLFSGLGYRVSDHNLRDSSKFQIDLKVGESRDWFLLRRKDAEHAVFANLHTRYLRLTQSTNSPSAAEDWIGSEEHFCFRRTRDGALIFGDYSKEREINEKQFFAYLVKWCSEAHG